MSNQASLTIAQVYQKIISRQYLLPSIQREFIWRADQIERLFDSIMREYPINSFLFWEVPNSKLQDFKFYDFLESYHQRDSRHNNEVNTNGLQNITAILDGQQRLNSIYIGLHGTYAWKIPYMRYDNPIAYSSQKRF